MPTPENIIPGLCQCGCGLPTKKARQTIKAYGISKGSPMRFIHGHNTKFRKHTQRSIDLMSHARAKHGHTINGKPSRTFVIWSSMKQRCYNPNTVFYRFYGGRGIKVCDRWRESFGDFLEDMGEVPKGLTLNRIDNDGNYEPGNCNWATRREQSLNKSNTIFLSYMGGKYTITQLSELLGIDRRTLSCRISRGWPNEELGSMPRNTKRKL